MLPSAGAMTPCAPATSSSPSGNDPQESRSITAYNMMEKHQLRKQLLAARKAMAPEEKAWRDKAIAERLLAWLETNPAECIGVYWPPQGEPARGRVAGSREY